MIKIMKLRKWKKLIKDSGMFDLKYYLFTYPDVRLADVEPIEHFIKYGALESRNPSKEFNTSFYLKHYNDVRESNINPLVHYILHGKNEGRLKNINELNKKNIDKNKPYNFNVYPQIKKHKSTKINALQSPSYESLKWLLDTTLHEDNFYALIFIRNINLKRYIEANNDVKDSLQCGTLSKPVSHLIHHGLHDILAQRRDPYTNISLNSAILGHIDKAIITSKNSFFLNGWFFSKNHHFKEILLSYKKNGINLTKKIEYYAREDLREAAGSKANHAGFYCFVDDQKINTDTLLSYGLIIVTEDGLSKRIPIELEINSDRIQVSQIILENLKINSSLHKKLDRTIGAALKKYLSNNKLSISDQDIKYLQFGARPQNPKLSIIIPLYGRIDFVEYQLSKFANDPFLIDNVELLYVLDDPGLEDELERICYNNYPIFKVPFSLISYDQNAGYAIANNIGVSQARSELILLLNSDILPIEDKWIQRLMEAYDSLDDAGVVCPKLLFEDGAIQHAGMTFEYNYELSVWLNEHPGKGLPDLNPVTQPEAMPAVTGACMIISKELYLEMGGLSEIYFLGDFEDSDLCLKLSQKGYKSYYIPSIKLCHLERQSQSLFNDSLWKGKVTIYNAWQHDRMWAKDIATIMKKYYER